MKKVKTLTEGQEKNMFLAEQIQSKFWTLELLLEQVLNESTLSRMIGKDPGGQALVRWLHAKHRLSNVANYEQHPFDQRMMWTEFKNHPDNFLILVGSSGVAGIKPYKDDIDRGYKRAAKSGKTYNPSRDTSLRYQIVAFRGDQQVDPELLRDPEDVERDKDPTVMRARGGMIYRYDARNPNNIFDRIRENIGSIRYIYVASSAVEREKMQKRTPAEEKPADIGEEKRNILNKLRPILKKVGYQALSIVSGRIKKYNDGGNYEKAAEAAQVGKQIKDFMAEIDVTGEVNLSRGMVAKVLSEILNAVDRSSQEEAAKKLRSMKAAQMGPVLDAVRSTLLTKQYYYE